MVKQTNKQTRTALRPPERRSAWRPPRARLRPHTSCFSCSHTHTSPHMDCGPHTFHLCDSYQTPSAQKYVWNKYIYNKGSMRHTTAPCLSRPWSCLVLRSLILQGHLAFLHPLALLVAPIWLSTIDISVPLVTWVANFLRTGFLAYMCILYFTFLNFSFTLLNSNTCNFSQTNRNCVFNRVTQYAEFSRSTFARMIHLIGHTTARSLPDTPHQEPQLGQHSVAPTSADWVSLKAGPNRVRTF